MDCLPPRKLYPTIPCREFTPLTIVHRYLEEAMLVNMLPSQRLEAPEPDILTKIARPELFSQCHIGHLPDLKLLKMEIRPLRSLKPAIYIYILAAFV